MPSQTDPAPPAAAPKRPRLTLAEPADLGLGVDTRAFPTEDALLLRVPLPLAGHRARQTAVGFAVEDLIAEPLDAVHVALGPELGPGEYLAAVVRHAAMARHAPAARDAGARLVPDALGLAVPSEGRIAVRERAGRVLARRADGTGYAAPLDVFETLWRLDGAPQIVLFGGRLPEGVPISAAGILPAAPPPDGRLDLLQGAYARTRGTSGRLIRRLAVVAVLALAGHAAVLAAESVALGRIAATREAELRAALAARVEGIAPDLPLDAALRVALPDAPPAGSAFLPLLAQVADVLAPHGGGIALRNLAFGAGDASLALLLEAADLAALQRIEAELAAAGLRVAAGVATTGDGAAEVRFVIQAAGP